MEVLFVIWAGIIPLVPLIGVQLFKQRCDKRKAAVCRLLFFGQAILSLTYIAVYFGIAEEAVRCIDCVGLFARSLFGKAAIAKGPTAARTVPDALLFRILMLAGLYS